MMEPALQEQDLRERIRNSTRRCRTPFRGGSYFITASRNHRRGCRAWSGSHALSIC